MTASATASTASKVTPMMAQFLDIREKTRTDHPGVILFYRMGDFYELFFDDAVKAAEALDITLTKRGKHEGEDIPMCGVPVHSSETYLERLIRKGFKVAVCEQTENPAEAKKRGSKAVVSRDVVRVVTPGTLTEDTLLDARENNYLVALSILRGAGQMALSWTDLSTGEFYCASTSEDALAADLARLDPGELLVPERAFDDPSLFELFNEMRGALTPLNTVDFDSQAGERRLKELFGVASLDAFGSFSRSELSALGALLCYAELTQKGKLPRLRPPVQQSTGGVMIIDAATRRNLELSRTLAGDRSGSLLATIDRTVSGAGARSLAMRLASPLTNVKEIDARHDVVQYFSEHDELREVVRKLLRQTPDLERSLSRLTVGRGGPRDLAAIRDGLKQAAHVKQSLLWEIEQNPGLATPPENFSILTTNFADQSELVEQLTIALAPELPLIARDGGFIAKGYDATLDEFRLLRDESRRVIAGLESGYKEQTGVNALKVRHNQVLGYYIEVPAAHGDKLMGEPLSDVFIHRQTLANAVRFTTVELSELDSKITQAAGRSITLELELFEKLTKRVISEAAAISVTAETLADLDVGTALAHLAVEENWTRPIVDQSLAFEINQGRHPVVERALRATPENPAFIPNDCSLSADNPERDRRLWLVTGPNMAGKSTFLRQNAVIAILAQIGAFVPAKSAHIGVIDRLFSRVGAADDLARGRSTFMVEMIETATILNQATDRSLVILDEIGRGTATFDGLSIAWATVEHLHEQNRSRALFATHYHELTALTEKLDGLANATMKVREWEGDVVFLHEVIMGAADRSYGIQVAKLAGLPSVVISRAGQILDALERGDEGSGTAKKVTTLVDDLPLFSHVVEEVEQENTEPSSVSSPVLDRLNEISPDDLTPREALDLLYELKRMD